MNKFRKFYTKLVMWVSVIASLISVASAVLVCSNILPRYNLGLDYLGLLVGILAFLVTLLLGWQIYDRMTMSQQIERVAKDVSFRERPYIQHRIYEAQYDVYQKCAICFVKDEEWYSVITMIDGMVMMSSKLQRKKDGDALIANIIAVFARYPDFDKQEKDRFKQLIDHLPSMFEFCPDAQKAHNLFTELFIAAKRGSK